MKIKKGFILRNIGSEQVIVGEGIEQVNFNKIISMNNTAVFLWNELQGKEFDVADAARLLTDNYEVQEEKALADVRSLLQQWVAVGIAE